jgi:hypothetical protein
VTRRSTGVTVLIVAAAVVATIVVLGIVGAVAVPVFLAQRMRAEWRSTTFALPETFEGVPRVAVPETYPVGAGDTLMAVTQAAGYDNGPLAYHVVVGKGRDPLSVEDQAGLRQDILAGWADSAYPVHLTEQEPGRLGGWFGCGSVPGTPSTACIATDHAGLVTVITSGGSDAVAEVRRLREAVEKRS